MNVKLTDFVLAPNGIAFFLLENGCTSARQQLRNQQLNKDIKVEVSAKALLKNVFYSVA